MPLELRQLPRWVVWKGPKMPYCAAAFNSLASSTNPDTWATFEQTRTAYEEGGWDGVGFVFNGDGIVGVDLDHCVDDDVITPAALSLLKELGAQYVEFSPSGTGLHALGFGTVPKRCKGVIDGVSVELYAQARYFTMTGRAVSAGPLVELPGFASLAARLGPIARPQSTASGANDASFDSLTEDKQMMTEDNNCHLLAHIPSDTMPTQAGERNERLFLLARHLKAEMPDAPLDTLRPIVQAWHRMALPVIGTKEFAVTWQDFVRGWQLVKVPLGADVLATILADVDPFAPLPDGMKHFGYGPQCRHLVHICRALQEHHDPAPFFLSARQAGKLISMNRNDANIVLGALVSDKVLALVSKGAGLKASRFRFIWQAASNEPEFSPAPNEASVD